MKVIITFTFCCDNLWKSKFMALEMSGKLRKFFSATLWPPCNDTGQVVQICTSETKQGVTLSFCSTKVLTKQLV